MIKLEKVSAGYSRDAPILQSLTLNIDSDDRIALLGANGNGKSTFAKLLSNRLEHVDGTLVKAAKIKIAMFAQHQMDDLVPEQTPIDHVRKLMPKEGEAKIRSKVAQFGLGQERMETKCKNLSGGEKARLLLGLCCFEGPDLLILDEPTNHLDVGAREALVHAINAYKGAVILISHDRHLIDATMDRLWLVKDGNVQPFDEDLEAYKKLLLQKDGVTSSKSDSAGGSRQASRKQAADRRKELAPLRAKMVEKERQMEKLTDAIAKLDKSLATPGIFENHPDKATKFAKQRAEADRLMEQVESEWLALGEELENAG